MSEDKADRNIKILYILYGLGAFFGGFTVAGLIMAYVQEQDRLSEVQAAHCRWLRNTFWVTAAGTVIGAVLALVLVGYLIIAATWIWYVYRVIKGWVRYSENRRPGKDNAPAEAEGGAYEIAAAETTRD